MSVFTILLATVLASGASTVHSERDPVRVATLVPWVHEFAALASDRVAVVASTRSRVHAAGDDSGSEPGIDLGSPHAPSVESLVAARADVVVFDTSMHARIAPKLEVLVPRAIAADGRSVDTTLRSIRQVADALDVPDVGAACVVAIEEALERHGLEGEVTALTLYAAPGAPVVVTDRTWLGDLLARLGVRDAAAGVSGREGYPGYVTPSEESLSTLRADWILLVAHGSTDEALEVLRQRMENEVVWKGLRESVGERILVLDEALFGANPGPRLDEATAWLSERLEGDRP